MKKHIFTIMAGCVPVGHKMLESYFDFHSENIHIYLFAEDMDLMRKSDYYLPSFQKTYHLLPESLREPFFRGHEGTAKVWARIIRDNPDTYLIQIDSDVIFKKESLSLIEKQNYPDLYGSRRCYKNNPADIPVADGIEDALSTYFIGFNTKTLSMSWEKTLPVLERMCQGAYNPLGFPVFDFFDPIFFVARSHGASVYYEDPDLIGGQNEQGNKINNYTSNLHLDMGSHLCHFGGAGSGYAACVDDSNMNKSYSNWAKHRWFLFEDLFYEDKINIESYSATLEKTIIKDDGRWVSGPHNIEIFNQIKQDLIN